MHKLGSLALAKLAKVFSRLSTRLKSTGGGPSAPLGSRILTNPDDIFKHNMWDHVQWTEEDKENARQKAQENSCEQIPLKEQGKFDTEAYQYWDKFYEMHRDKFFKDRKWLFLEFPELLLSDTKKAKSQATTRHQGDQQAEIPLPSGSSKDTETRHHQQSGTTHHHSHNSNCQKACQRALEKNEDDIQTSTFPGQHASFRILEVGCGVGNSVFPIVSSIKETDAFLYCCDFSPRAIQLVKSLDVILAVFVLSSIHPERMQGVVNRLSTYLKHGGIFLFRDYGRYDFSQLRFKKGQYLSENFYTRGDGTCVYFFTKEEVHDLFSNAGLEEIQNLEDRRLQVNRGKKVAMHRVWMQSKYRKSYPTSPS
ncbi:mRNA N(3)-methylcytidine methyltransferase METTL8 isoform X2 [Xiphias gladius]|uniref:mRNA N(3)-methylcytidine methyltransferase METTL8 isoform X2 n=1 Tax=Xiphias gladius TaxID=8245 RepID=UPI001A9964A3|nr:mRNA N(3)-methylcytidine methyltransferase METTL8 isoform X2 [Xiphias gladius]